MKSILIVLGVFISIKINSQIAVKASHPRVLLDSSIILKLKSRAISNTVEWQQLVARISGVSGYNSQAIMSTVYEGQEYAFMYALSFYATGNTAHRDSAISIFKEYFNKYTSDSTMYYDSGYESRSTLVETAMLYDWLYPYLSPAFRSSVRARLIFWGNWIITQPGVYGYWTGPYYYEGNNYTMGHFVGLTSLGFAIQSEDAANGNKFIGKVDSIRPFLISFANTRLKNGDANEGWGYGAGYAVNYFKALAIFKTGTGGAINHFTNTTYDEGVAKFLPFASLPDLAHMLPEGDWARESTGEIWDYHRLAADLVSTYSNDSVSQRTSLFWANEVLPVSNFAVTAYRWYPFLFSNKEITPLDYRTQAAFLNNYLYTDTSGTDQFIRRTGWGATDQWVSYRAGGRYGDHSHNGSGHFSVYDNGWLLIDKNIYASSGIEGQDSMHNCIHFQKMNGIEMYPFKDPIEHSFGRRRDLNSEYSYLWTGSTPIYTARSIVYNCVAKNERQFFYIPGLKKIAIFDITKTNNTDRKWFGINYNGNPSLSSDSSYSFYSNSQKTAYVKTCYPLAKNVMTFGRSVRVGNAYNQQKDYFMHLVSVLPNSSSAPIVIPVNRDNGKVLVSEFYGSYHQESIRDYCILFAGDDPFYNHDSLVYEVPATTNTLHSYIAGLNLSGTYYVSATYPGSGKIRVRVSILNSPNAIAYTSTTGGILSFDIPNFSGIYEWQNVDNSFNVFYNKSNEEILIEDYSAKSGIAKIKVFDALGNQVFSTNLQNLTSYTIPSGQLAKGIYLVSIETQTEIKCKKIAVY